MNTQDSNISWSRQSVLEKARQFFGYTPNLIAEMSHSAVAADAYIEVLRVLREHSTLTQAEQQIVMLSISAWNGCQYCIAAHRMAARRSGVPQDELDRVSRIEMPVDRRLQALANATWVVIDMNGRLQPDDLEAFEDLGIEKAQFYEIITLVGVELMANFVDHFANVPLDAAIVSQKFRSLRNRS